jgi:REP element-mobilizing transposase RayT
MGYARKNLISLQDTPYYHCIARCVRRSWLWGVDEYAGKDYSHRKQWVLTRLEQLCAIFSIEVCAYAVMSNHYHLVLHVDASQASGWTQAEVVERWTRLFRAPTLVQRWSSGEALDTERAAAERIIERWRQRLCDVSWYMRCLNEYLARRANQEDRCKGRFWEGRFKSQALLDEAGLLTAMAYVDLNPIRAGIAKSPEESEFTSIYQRIARLRNPRRRGSSAPIRPRLAPFSDEADRARARLPFTLRDYLALVDWSGRAIRADKRGFIDAALPPILRRIGVEAEAWDILVGRRGTLFGRAMGRLDAMRMHAATLGQSWIRGVGSASRLFPNIKDPKMAF